MKKTVLFCTAALMMAGCKVDTGYVVEGKVPGASDGEYVYMKMPSGDEFVVTDSARIDRQTFEFRGQAGSVPDVCYLVYESDENAYNTEVVLENGRIDVTLADTCSVTGTKENEKFRQFVSAINGLQGDLDGIAARYGVAEEADRKALEKEYTDKLGELDACLKKYIEDNINTVTGVFMLSQVSETMPFETVKGYVDKITGELRNSDMVQDMVKRLDNKKTVEEDKMLVDFTMTDIKGGESSFLELVGKKKITLVDFWASWCGPCMREVPAIKKIYEEYKDKDFQIIGISLDKEDDAWRKAVKSKKLTWHHLSDLKGWKSEAARIYGVNSIPSLMVVTADGKILGQKLTSEEAAEIIAENLK